MHDDRGKFACLQAWDLCRWQGVTLRGSRKEDFRLFAGLLRRKHPRRAVLTDNLHGGSALYAVCRTHVESSVVRDKSVQYLNHL